MVKRVVALLALGTILAGLLFYSEWRAEPLVVSGFIEADEIRVGSRVGGRVASVLVEEGSSITKGQTLVKLEPFDLLERRAQAAAELSARKAEHDKLRAGFRSEEKSQAKARVDQLAARLEKLINGPRKEELSAAQARVRFTQAGLELAQTNYARTESLLNRQVATAEDMDQATKELKAARASVEVRTEELSLLLEGTRPEEIAEARAQKEEARQAWLLTENVTASKRSQKPNRGWTLPPPHMPRSPGRSKS